MMTTSIGSAQAIPVPLEEPLCAMKLQPNADKLSDVLFRLSTTVSKNAKALMDVIDDVHHMKATLDLQVARQRKIETQVHDDRQHFIGEFEQLQSQIQTIEMGCAWRRDVDSENDRIWGSLNRANDFIDEIESGRGERVQHFVKSYVDYALPKWYETVSGPMWATLEQRFVDVRSDSAKKLEARAVQAEDKAKGMVATSKQHLTEQMFQLIEERRREVKKLRDQTEERLTLVDERIDVTNDRWPAALAETNNVLRGRLDTIGHRSAVLHKALCIEESLCDELIESCGGMDLCQCNLGTFEAQEDPRVLRIQKTPHFLHLRTTMQQEVTDRIELMKAEVHEDLAEEMFDLQKEMKGKVTQNKMPQLMEMHKDQGLYTNVRNLLSEVQELRRNKLDNGLFVDALKTKADKKLVDNKVDRQVLTSGVSAVTSRVDDLHGTVARIQERLKETEIHHKDLEILVKTGKPPDRDFPAIKTAAELFEEHIRKTKGALQKVPDLNELVPPPDVIQQDGEEKRGALQRLAPSKPHSARSKRTGTTDRLGSAERKVSPPKSARVGSGKAGYPIRGAPPGSRVQSARPSIQHRSSVAMPSSELMPALIPMTEGQKSYCEAMGLEEVETQRLWSAPLSRGSGRGGRGTSAGRGRGRGHHAASILQEPGGLEGGCATVEDDETEIGAIVPDLMEARTPSPPYFPELEGQGQQADDFPVAPMAADPD